MLFFFFFLIESRVSLLMIQVCIKGLHKLLSPILIGKLHTHTHIYIYISFFFFGEWKVIPFAFVNFVGFFLGRFCWGQRVFSNLFFFLLFLFLFWANGCVLLCEIWFDGGLVLKVKISLVVVKNRKCLCDESRIQWLIYVPCLSL